MNRAVKDIRQKVNDMIGESTGDEVFKGQLKQLSLLYEANHRIAEQNWRLFQSNLFKRWAKQHPKQARAIKFLVLGTVGVKILD